MIVPRTVVLGLVLGNHPMALATLPSNQSLPVSLYVSAHQNSLRSSSAETFSVFALTPLEVRRKTNNDYLFWQIAFAHKAP